VSISLPGPYVGIGYGLKGLAVLVLGGLGSVPGAIAGGLLMGLAEALVPSQASGWRDALAFAILFAVLLLRPTGLLGRRLVEKV
jgi:branched-chain amino acid transport system permease protein